MPNTARQNFINKIKQCINLLKTVSKYLVVIGAHCGLTDYAEAIRVFGLYNKILKQELERFLSLVRGW